MAARPRGVRLGNTSGAASLRRADALRATVSTHADNPVRGIRTRRGGSWQSLQCAGALLARQEDGLIRLVPTAKRTRSLIITPVERTGRDGRAPLITGASSCRLREVPDALTAQQCPAGSRAHGKERQELF